MPSYETFASKKKNKLNKVIEFYSNKKCKNSADDIDISLFSLPHFLSLLAKGDFNMMETLYAPKDKILKTSPILEELIGFRKYILTSDITSFMGFFKNEYKEHHSINNDFYKVRTLVIDFLNSLDTDKGVRLRDHKSAIELFASNNSDFVLTEVPVLKEQSVQEVIEFTLMQYPMGARINYVIDKLEYLQSKTSHRKKTKSTKGLSHCLRLLYQAQDLLRTGEFSFPLSKDRLDKIMQIKVGTMDIKDIKVLIEQEFKIVKSLESTSYSNKKSVQRRLVIIKDTLQARMEINYLLFKK